MVVTLWQLTGFRQMLGVVADDRGQIVNGLPAVALHLAADADRFHAHNPRPARIVEQVEHRLADGVRHPFVQVPVGVVQRRGQDRAGGRHQVVEHRPQQGFATIELLVEVAGGHAAGGADQLDRRVGITALAEQRQPGVEQALAALAAQLFRGAAAVTAAGGLGGHGQGSNLILGTFDGHVSANRSIGNPPFRKLDSPVTLA